ncbi:Hypothetical predicted protein [Pelobates cultripes]|uniref:Uncharacterized protein n=1 Tax=Pelobates cultripes TaxID=61616 RepID=A0AAD1T3Z5_PELCU|nr:Hypothetical predicted protein [Pelobates cultripes]
MPFLYPQTSRKTQRKTGAYTAYQASRFAQELTALKVLQDPYLQTGTAAPNDYNMGRKSQRPTQNTSRTTQDIGDLLQRPTAPKMAASPDRTTASQDEGEQSGAEQELLTAHPIRDPQTNRTNLTPATKQDIADLLKEMRQMHAADMDLLRTEMQAIITRTQATEEDTLDLKQEEAEQFLRALGIHTGPAAQETPTSSHTWDPDRMTPFILRNREHQREPT